MVVLLLLCEVKIVYRDLSNLLSVTFCRGLTCSCLSWKISIISNGQLAVASFNFDIDIQRRRHQYGRYGNCHTWDLKISKTGDTMGKIRWHRGQKQEKIAKNTYQLGIKNRCLHPCHPCQSGTMPPLYLSLFGCKSSPASRNVRCQSVSQLVSPLTN